MSDNTEQLDPSKRATSSILERLETVLQQRKHADADNSYVASLYNKGLNKILEKVGEEATEVILASKDVEQKNDEKGRNALISETADLWFHTMIMLSEQNISIKYVLSELDRRFGLSGHDEKAARKTD